MRAAARLRRTAPPVCAWCGGDIDLSLHWKNAWSWTADHIQSLASGGDPDGPLQPMHRGCNASKGSGIPRASRRRKALAHPGLS